MRNKYVNKALRDGNSSFSANSGVTTGSIQVISKLSFKKLVKILLAAIILIILSFHVITKFV